MQYRDAFAFAIRVCLFLCFIKIPILTLAQTNYAGRDPNASWRAAAQIRIDQQRKADVNVSVRRTDGSMIPDAKVNVSMQRHAFQFGTAVDPRYFLEGESDYDPRYESTLKSTFNSAVMENATKWKPWSSNSANGLNREIALQGIDWLRANDSDVRGHTMIWPRAQSVPDSVRELLEKENPTQVELQQLYDSTFDHIQDIGTATKDSIYAWDVVNEPRSSFDIEDKLIGFTPNGKSTINNRTDLRKQWFTAAKETVPDALMMLNDFSVLTGGDTLRQSRVDNFAILQDLVAVGTPIEGIGFQSHFKDPLVTGSQSAPTGIENLLAILDDYREEFDVPIHVTEFDFVTDDTDLQADYTRDFLTAAFSHESIEAFMTWGFWEGKMANPEAAFYDANFNLTAGGQAFVDLVTQEWWTDELGLTDQDGELSLRGFQGDYLISVEVDGETQQFSRSLGDGGLDLQFTFASVPEPGVFTLLVVAAIGTLGRRRRSK